MDEDVFIGEVRLFAGAYAPQGFVFCDGGPLPISQYDVLYSLLGTSFGGDGVTTFNVPDLRGRVPVSMTGPSNFATSGGAESVTLTVDELPAHTHPLLGQAETGTESSPAGQLPASSESITPYTTQPPDGTFGATAVTAAGESNPHSNLQPYVCLNYIIATEGIYPPIPQGDA